MQQHYALNTDTFFFPRVEVAIPSVNYKAHCPIVYIYDYSSLFVLLMLHWFIFVKQILYSLIFFEFNNKFWRLFHLYKL